MKPLLIKNAVIIDPVNSSKGLQMNIPNGMQMNVLIGHEGLIEKIAPDISDGSGAEIIDAEGCFLMPGITDLHAHFRHPGQEYKDRINLSGQSAAKGGITRVLAMPNTEPTIDNPEIISKMLSVYAEESPVEILQVSAMTERRGGRVPVDLFLNKYAGAVAFSDDGSAIQDRLDIAEICRRSAYLDTLLIEHPEIDFLSFNRPVGNGKIAEILNVRGQPPESESLDVLTMGALAGMFQARVHFTHLSTALSVEAVRYLKKCYPGLFTADVTPHHIALNEMDALSDGKMIVNRKMNPPLRPEKDRLSLIEGLIDGTIDAIATDHAPHAPEDKNKDFKSAAFGTIGFETMLPVSFTEMVCRNGMKPEIWAEKLTLNPSRILRIPYRGIFEGGKADLVLFHPDKKTFFPAGKFLSQAQNSAFENTEYQGEVRLTMAEGRIVYQKKITDE